MSDRFLDPVVKTVGCGNRGHGFDSQEKQANSWKKIGYLRVIVGFALITVDSRRRTIKVDEKETNILTMTNTFDRNN